MALPAFRPSIWRASRLRGGGAATTRATEFGVSTYEGLRWRRERSAGRRWAIAGALVGALLGT
ncbi:MAG: hypothetical protein H0W48_15075, partial [Methylibium sp.]|nr:hypothetical protein [Methylibium sp.]